MLLIYRRYHQVVDLPNSYMCKRADGGIFTEAASDKYFVAFDVMLLDSSRCGPEVSRVALAQFLTNPDEGWSWIT